MRVGGYEPQVLHATFLVADDQLASVGDAAVDEIKDRMAYMLCDQLVKHLMESKGGAVYSPVTFTIRSDDFNMTRVAGTVNALRLPDPETQEYRLIGGPLHDGIIRVGDPAPRFYRIPYTPPLFAYYPSPDPVAYEYERIEGAQAYRYWRPA